MEGHDAQRTDHLQPDPRVSHRLDGIASATVNVEQARRNVHVAWNRTGGSGAFGVSHDIGWVQLGIDVSIADLRSMLASAEAEAHAEARKLADFGEFDLEAWQFRVVSDVLDRREANLAIATLRRARDTAYGKDA
jgi:hypothetical protein